MRAPEGSSVPLTEALRAKRLAEADTPLERKMIFLANAVVVVCIVVVALVFMLSRLPDPQPKKAARAKKPALGKDGRYTAADVAKHAAEDDAWIIIKGVVYDVTSYVDEHPGGQAILRHAGGDSTEGFMGPQHPPRVFHILDDFRARGWSFAGVFRLSLTHPPQVGTLVEETAKDK